MLIELISHENGFSVEIDNSYSKNHASAIFVVDSSQTTSEALEKVSQWIKRRIWDAMEPGKYSP